MQITLKLKNYMQSISERQRGGGGGGGSFSFLSVFVYILFLQVEIFSNPEIESIKKKQIRKYVENFGHRSNF